ncbi:GNAT family N-acetyltransferase [Kribbella sp. NBC_01245]|uniref:GNAT family N-acetyltransferase n=1 Tax=Kribbella sp. NBC_01245 TaxID=2903578 RepID=UPI002E2D506C|nr:GNAT family N-acetyltransferase [Kribbella sp. NBC_01245]
MTELYRPAAIDFEKHNRDYFESTDESLNTWQRQYSKQNRRKDFAATWVVADAEYRIVGYATLTMSGLDLSSAPAAIAKGAPKQVPVLLCGRLAVDRRYAGAGIGSTLVQHVLTSAIELNEKAACKAVVVNALNPTARSWWTRFGFSPFNAEPDNLDLYLLTKEAAATLAALQQR